MIATRLMDAYAACFTALLLLFLATARVQAIPIPGQGTWEATLKARDFDGDASSIEGWYDTVLDITWLADANYARTSGFDFDGRMTFQDAVTWAAFLDVDGITGWRLPTTDPVNGVSYNTNFTTNAASDKGYADNAGWVDSLGNPVSEMGHMYYVTLGNLGYCPPDGGDGNAGACDNAPQPGSGLSNTGLFSNIQSSNRYWSGSVVNSLDFRSPAWTFNFSEGFQDNIDRRVGTPFAWAVHSGDVGAAVVPLPAAIWFIGSGLIGLVSIGRQSFISKFIASAIKRPCSPDAGLG